MKSSRALPVEPGIGLALAGFVPSPTVVVPVARVRVAEAVSL